MYISIIYTSFYIYTYIQSKSKKLAALGGKFYLYCATLVRCFFQYFWNFEIFFGIPMAQKNPRTFYFSKSKVQKSKNVYINYFYQNLRFYKDWITESKKIRNIVKRKFAIFSSGLIFKEKLFEFSSSFLLSIYVLNVRCSVETRRTNNKQRFLKN